jgi:hypothetical protein
MKIVNQDDVQIEQVYTNSLIKRSLGGGGRGILREVEEVCPWLRK